MPPSWAPDISPAFNHATVDGNLPRWSVMDITWATIVVHGAHNPIGAPAVGEAITAEVAAARLLVRADVGH